MGGMENEKSQYGSYISIAFVALSSILAFTSCGRSGPHKVISASNKMAEKTKDAGAVTYLEVKPIFEARCSRCHPAMSGPNWLDENQARSFAENGKLHMRVADQKTMPMPGSKEAAEMSDKERKLIAAYALSVKSIPTTVEEVPGKTAPDQTAPDQTAPDKTALLDRCVNCHGPNGVSLLDNVPHLAGQNKEYLINELKSFRSGQRQDRQMKAMNGIAEGLSDVEIEDVATAFSQLTFTNPPREKNPDIEKKIEGGKQLAANHCVGCHLNEQGLAASGIWPNLAGQKQSYLLNQLMAFRRGDRSGTMMPNVVGEKSKLSEADLEMMSIYFHYLK